MYVFLSSTGWGVELKFVVVSIVGLVPFEHQLLLPLFLNYASFGWPSCPQGSDSLLYHFSLKILWPVANFVIGKWF